MVAQVGGRHGLIRQFPVGAAARLVGPLLQATRAGQMVYRSNKPLPAFDLEAMSRRNSGVEVHNPLLAIELLEKAEHRRRTIEAQKEQQAYIPDIRGSHPLSLESEYKRRRAEFYRVRDGILGTPTRKYAGMIDACRTDNPKVAFGVVKVYAPHQENVRPKGEDRRYDGEFAFARSGVPYTAYVAHFDLYVRMLHTLPAANRAKYFDDFYYFMKAVRQRPKTHRKILNDTRFKQSLTGYFLLCGQNHLALFAATMLVPKTIPEVLERWTIIRILGVPQMYAPETKQINDIRAVEEGNRPDAGMAFDIEYRYNMLAHAVTSYYNDSPHLGVTDTELICLIRVLEARKLKGCLKNLLPLVINRHVNGAAAEPLDKDRLELAYDSSVFEQHVSELQLGARYALALLHVEDLSFAKRTLATVADMPPRAIPGTKADTCSVARLILNATEADDFPGLLMRKILLILSRNQIEDPTQHHDTASIVSALTSAIRTEQVSSSSSTASHALTELVTMLGQRMQASTAMAIIRQLEKDNTRKALQWVAMNLQLLDHNAQGESIEWVLEKLRDRRDIVTTFLQRLSKESPLVAAQLAHLLTRRLWDHESDRRFVQTKVFGEILRTGDMPAIGMSLVSAALGPDTRVLSPFGPQSATERSRTVVKLLALTRSSTAPNTEQLMSYLFKVAGSLQARETESLLWREVLRRGIEPTRRMLQAAIPLRLGSCHDHGQVVELIEHAMRKHPVAGDAGPSQQPGTPMSGETSALYMSILNGLNHGGRVAEFEILAEYLLKSGRLDNRTFGALASAWLDATGYRASSTCADVRRVWEALKEHTASGKAAGEGALAHRLNRNHYHSIIEAFVRLGDVGAAWNVIRADMREAGLAPDLMTFYTLTSPLASNTALWAVGKSTVANFNTHYPHIVQSALADKSNTLVVKALLHQVLGKSENP
ncbi:hypothetical protein LPJ61_000111 [Coemansia biformis]|uniref:Uncharacterized protein n=1 Tax=Coemansia biformis TaxID=1286918 RepID=A0A9W8D1G1_9FUNG|nr:hypothetical protein LPJ61_000111 [Coemansia biformis]